MKINGKEIKLINTELFNFHLKLNEEKQKMVKSTFDGIIHEIYKLTIPSLIFGLAIMTVLLLFETNSLISVLIGILACELMARRIVNGDKNLTKQQRSMAYQISIVIRLPTTITTMLVAIGALPIWLIPGVVVLTIPYFARYSVYDNYRRGFYGWNIG
jgi:hypothetical protein